MISGLRRERFLTCLEANRLNRTSTSVRKAGSKENKSKFENPLLSRPTIGFWSKAELTPIPRSRIHFPSCNRDCDECRLSPHLFAHVVRKSLFAFPLSSRLSESPALDQERCHPRPTDWVWHKGTVSSGPKDSVGAARATSSNVPPHCEISGCRSDAG